MAILEEYVAVTLTSRVIPHYEALGYNIPRRKARDGIMRVTRGTVIRIKVIDLPPMGDVRLTKICDTCGGHVREQPYQAILRSRDNGIDTCTSCANTVQNNRRALQLAKSGHNLANKNPEVVTLWHPTLNGALTPSEITPQSNKRRWWLCDEAGCGHEWEAPVQRVVNGSRCPVCSMSKGERRIREYIRFLGYGYSMEEPMSGLLGEGGFPLRYDVAIKYPSGDISLLIEYDGIGHAEPTDFLGKGEAHALEKFQILREHDRRKNEYARLHNIPLLRIAHTEIDDTERLINEALAKVLRGDQIPC